MHNFLSLVAWIAIRVDRQIIQKSSLLPWSITLPGATAAVGLITEPDQAEEIVQAGCADLVLCGRG
jgi:2,4-dienoyl-CoA reductase-like NADH-dependent reductase (Old Yellow Enzyme family)